MLLLRTQNTHFTIYSLNEIVFCFVVFGTRRYVLTSNGLLACFPYRERSFVHSIPSAWQALLFPSRGRRLLFHWRVPSFLYFKYSTFSGTLQLANCKKYTIIFCLKNRFCSLFTFNPFTKSKTCAIINMLCCKKAPCRSSAGRFFYFLR